MKLPRAHPRPGLRGRHKELSYGMVICRNRGLFIAAISLSLLAGCASSSTTSRAGAGSSPSSVKVSSKKSPVLDQNRVEAYAHYLQGTIYEQEEKVGSSAGGIGASCDAGSVQRGLGRRSGPPLSAAKQPEKALTLLTRATAIPGASGTLFAQLGLVYSQLDKEDAAIAACQNAIKISPSSSDGYRVLFFIRVQTGKTAEARKVLEQALKVPDTQTGIRTWRSLTYARFLGARPHRKKQRSPVARWPR